MNYKPLIKNTFNKNSLIKNYKALSENHCNKKTTIHQTNKIQESKNRCNNNKENTIVQTK